MASSEVDKDGDKESWQFLISRYTLVQASDDVIYGVVRRCFRDGNIDRIYMIIRCDHVSVVGKSNASRSIGVVRLQTDERY